MITFFTTFKNFKGKNRINQLNAIRSWLYLDKNIEVIVFSESDGIEEVLQDERVIHIKNIERYENRIPLIGPMFNHADRISTKELCCYVNADIILTQTFYQTLLTIHDKINKNYLLIGQRNDVDVTECIDFKNDWEKSFLAKYYANFKLHTPTGSDFFAFPKGQYANIKFPTLLVGRPGWDLWMIYNALQQNIKAIDLSPAVKVIHQNHDYKHKNATQAIREIEDNINYKSLPEQYYFFTLLACDYVFNKNQQLKKNYARGDQEHLLRMNIEMKRKRILSKLLLSFYSEKGVFTSNFSKNISSFLLKKIFIPLKIYN